MSNTRRKLENMAEMEKRNEQRIGAFISKEAEIEHKRERLAKMQAGTAKPGMGTSAKKQSPATCTN